MRNYLSVSCMILLAIAATGCSMCDTAHLCDYGGVGGKWQRGNPTCGRVGSGLSDAGATEQIQLASHSGNFDTGYGGEWEELSNEPTPAAPIESAEPMAFDEEFNSSDNDSTVYIGQ